MTSPYESAILRPHRPFDAFQTERHACYEGP